jgi:parvulin-like peptidyl-prolyl isomerase
VENSSYIEFDPPRAGLLLIQLVNGLVSGKRRVAGRPCDGVPDRKTTSEPQVRAKLRITGHKPDSSRKRVRIMNPNRIHKLAAVATSLLATALATGLYAQRTGTAPPSAAPRTPTAAKAFPAPSGKVVLKVGTQQVTVDDLNIVLRSLNPQDQKKVESQGRRPLAEQYALTLLLAQQGAQDHLDNTPDFRRQEAWTRAQRLAQAEYEKMAQTIKINPEEVGQYYSQHSKDFEQIEVRQVGIRKKPENAKPDAPGLTASDAEARAGTIRKALTAGTDIKTVTTEFAVPNVVLIDPGPKKLQHGQLSPDLEKSIFALKDGELSQSVNTPQSIVFIQVLKHVEPDVKEVQPAIEASLRQQKIQAELGDLRKKANVWMDEDYFKLPSAAPGQQGAAPTAPPVATPSPKPNQ